MICLIIQSMVQLQNQVYLDILSIIFLQNMQSTSLFSLWYTTDQAVYLNIQYFCIQAVYLHLVYGTYQIRSTSISNLWYAFQLRCETRVEYLFWEFCRLCSLPLYLVYGVVSNFGEEPEASFMNIESPLKLQGK